MALVGSAQPEGTSTAPLVACDALYDASREWSSPPFQRTSRPEDVQEAPLCSGGKAEHSVRANGS